MAQHIENISKNNFQMHMSTKVFEREQKTKICLKIYADDIYNMIYYNK